MAFLGRGAAPVRTGEPAFDHVFGMPLFDYYAANPAAARVGAAGLSARSAGENAAIVAAYDFSAADCVMDVGGGEGSLLRSSSPPIRSCGSVVRDAPRCRPGPGSTRRRPEIDRCELVAGDFFTAIPGRSSLLLLKKVIHDWTDERAATILRNCRAALPAGGRLLLVENVIPAGNEPSFGKWLDLLMLVYPEGENGLRTSTATCSPPSGFAMTQVIPT